MGAGLLESIRERSEERHLGESPVRESVDGDFDGSEDNDRERSKDRSKHKSKDKKKSRGEEKDHKGRDRERLKTHDGLKEREKEVKDLEKERILSKEKRKEGREEHEKDRAKDKGREKDHDRVKQRGKDHDRDRDEKERERKRDRERDRGSEPESNRGWEKERVVEKGKEKEKEKDKGRDRDRGKDREREKEKEKTRDREKEREKEKNRDKDPLNLEQDNSRDRGVEDYDMDRLRDRERSSRRRREDHDYFKDGGKDAKGKLGSDNNRDRETYSQKESSVPRDVDAGHVIQGDYVENLPDSQTQSQKDIEERIQKMKEQRLKESTSDILSWVSKSRKLEEKRNLERIKAKQRSKIFDEQENVGEEGEEADAAAKMEIGGLAGVKVLHGIDKVLEGGSVVLTLKDQDIIVNGDLNEDVDMLENVEIGEQKRRNEAYKAANKTSSYDDKFNEQLGEEKKMLPQYDDPEEESVTLDVAGRFTREAEKKLAEMRRKFENPSLKNQAENLNSSIQISSDYYTPEEMLKFKKPKKKKSLRKKEKLDIDALEAEARAEGLGSSDLGSRNDSKRQAAKEEEERAEAMRRSNAFQAAYAKADEASRALRAEQVTFTEEDEDADVFADDAEDLRKSLERARKLALKKQNEKILGGPDAIARLASAATSSQPPDTHNPSSGDASDNKIVFSEMEEFVGGLQLDEESQKPTHEDVFMDEDEPSKPSPEQKNEIDGRAEFVDSGKDQPSKSENKEDIVPDDILHEAPIGKGLFGALKMLNGRGMLDDPIEWGGRNMDKKKSKLVGIHVNEGPKEINLERTDEFGRTLTPKEAFRLISHKFHGKGPGKSKLEKRLKSFQEDQKRKKLASSDALPESVDRMREAQLQLKTPYLVLSGHVKPGQTSDPASGFATVEKQFPGSLTPMLGDEKVEKGGIKRKAEPGSSGMLGDEKVEKGGIKRKAEPGSSGMHGDEKVEKGGSKRKAEPDSSGTPKKPKT